MGIFDKIKKKKTGLEKASEKTLIKARTKKAEKTEGKKEKEPTKHIAPSKKGTAFAEQILRRPIVSEKATIGEQHGAYSFEVVKRATKIDVKRAVKELYGVTPAKVRIVNTQGRTTRFGRTIGRRSDEKKAVVTLPKGMKIDIHEGV